MSSTQKLKQTKKKQGAVIEDKSYNFLSYYVYKTVYQVE